MAAFSHVRPGAPGDIVRRTDSIGRRYYFDRERGKRTSKSEWQAERESIAFERAIVRAQLDEQRELERQQRPFPGGMGISPIGVPTRPTKVAGEGGEDFEGLEYEGFEPIAIEGEDDT